jgi:hypothetical protein
MIRVPREEDTTGRFLHAPTRVGGKRRRALRIVFGWRDRSRLLAQTFVAPEHLARVVRFGLRRFQCTLGGFHREAAIRRVESRENLARGDLVGDTHGPVDNFTANAKSKIDEHTGVNGAGPGGRQRLSRQNDGLHPYRPRLIAGL